MSRAAARVLGPVLGVLVGVMVPGTPAPAAELARHSGLVVAVDPAAGSLVLSEMGPWRVRGGPGVFTRRVVSLTDRTRVVRMVRVPDAPSGFANDFVEVVVGPDEVRPGVFVTVDALRQDGRLVATRIVVVVPPRPR
jgi:hypothetical protein